MTVIVRQPGMLTTIQDFGWRNRLHLSLSRGGAMDSDALATANQLVGNPLDACGLEFTGVGPTLFFEESLCIAWTGGVMSAVMTRTGQSQPVVLSSHRPIAIPAGATVRWGAASAGFRCWLAVTGGFKVTTRLGSCSSHLAAAIGAGPVVREQRIAVNPPNATAAALRAALSERESDATTWSVATTVPHSWPIIEVAALAGRHFNQLSEEDQRRLLDQGWAVSSSSNRQGVSLKGERLTTTLPNILSEPVREGTVQLPPSGLPIVLLAEHQSTGGYPRVLEVLSTEREVLAQAGPSARIVFRLVSQDQADQIQVRRRRSIVALRDAITSKLQTL